MILDFFAWFGVGCVVGRLLAWFMNGPYELMTCKALTLIDYLTSKKKTRGGEGKRDIR